MNKFVTICLLWLLGLMIPYGIAQISLDLGLPLVPEYLVSLLLAYVFIILIWIGLRPAEGEFYTTTRTFWFAVIVHLVGFGAAAFRPEYGPGGLLGIIIGHQLCKWTVYFYKSDKGQSAWSFR